MIFVFIAVLHAVSADFQIRRKLDMNKYALINARIIDGTGRGTLESGVLLINNGLIETVGAADVVPVPAGYIVIDARERTVLPGLFDAHMHVSNEPGRLDHPGHVRTNLQAVRKLRDCLQWGTCTVAHAAGSLESVILRDLIRDNTLADCSDLVVGAAVTPTCGHLRGRVADGPWEIRRVLRELIANGVDHIKTCASGGFQWDHEKLTHEDYTLEELRVLTDTAHSRDVRVHVHAHAQPGLANAIAAGCDVILHGAEIDNAALEGIAANGLWYMPTLHITSETIWSDPDWPVYMTRRMKAACPIHRAGVAKARSLGIRIAMGTDGGPGSIMNELVELVSCGFSPMEALVAATRNTADALGMLDNRGTLEAGKRADLLIVDGDPLQDIKIMKSQARLVLVMKAGRIFRATGGYGALPGSGC